MKVILDVFLKSLPLNEALWTQWTPARTKWLLAWKEDGILKLWVILGSLLAKHFLEEWLMFAFEVLIGKFQVYSFLKDNFFQKTLTLTAADTDWEKRLGVGPGDSETEMRWHITQESIKFHSDRWDQCGEVPPGDGKIAVENRAAWITERREVGRAITRMFVVVSAAMVNLCLCVWQQEDCGYFWKGGGDHPELYTAKRKKGKGKKIETGPKNYFCLLNIHSSIC